MAEARSAKLKRLANLQFKLGKLAELELAEVNAERRLTDARIEGIGEALASPNPVHHGFSRLYGQQLGRLKLKKQVLDGQARLIEKRLMSEKAKADRLEETSQSAAGEEQREAEDETILDLLDAIGARNSSLP